VGKMDELQIHPPKASEAGGARGKPVAPGSDGAALEPRSFLNESRGDKQAEVIQHAFTAIPDNSRARPAAHSRGEAAQIDVTPAARHAQSQVRVGAGGERLSTSMTGRAERALARNEANPPGLPRPNG